MLNKRAAACAAATISAMAITGLATAPTATATTPQTRHRVARTAPTWTADATPTGDATATKVSDFRVYLAPRGGLDALKRDVAAVSDPHNAAYGKFLSAKEFHAKYDATKTDAATVTTWLHDSGLTVTDTEAHHRYLEVQGTNASIEKAFATQLKTFRHDGQNVQANTTVLSVPNAIAARVLTVSGLDTTPRHVAHAPNLDTPAQDQPPAAGYRNAKPCSAYYGQVASKFQADYKTPLASFKGKHVPYTVCGYTGSQYRSAYEGAAAKTLDGKSVTVAITDAYASPNIAKDASTYASQHGDSAYGRNQLSQVTPAKYTLEKECGASGWYGEETLDVEAVHAMAPGAKIAYYASASCNDADFLATLVRVVDDNTASLVSNSWSDLEANESPDTVAAYEQVFLQGAMQGVGFLFSSGDNGDEIAKSNLKQVDYPASDPYATAVGGTADAIGANGSMMWQTGWGTQKFTLNAKNTGWDAGGFSYGAGGGTSSLFNQPDYQAGVVPSTHSGGRAVPDVAMDADPTTGMLIGQTQTFTDGVAYGENRVGGTSLAAPLMTGLAALRSQKTGKRLGFLNPLIYDGASGPNYNDVTGAPADQGNVRVDFKNGENPSGGLLYTVRTFNQDSSLATAKGWDDVTGVGSPNTSWVTAP